MAIPFITIILDKPYEIRFSMGAQVQYEQLSGKTIPQLGREMQTGLSMTTVNQMLYVMLKKDIKDLTLEKVCDLIDENVDNINDIIDAIVKVIDVAFAAKDTVNNQKNEDLPENLNG